MLTFNDSTATVNFWKNQIIIFIMPLKIQKGKRQTPQWTFVNVAAQNCASPNFQSSLKHLHSRTETWVVSELAARIKQLMKYCKIPSSAQKITVQNSSWIVSGGPADSRMLLCWLPSLLHYNEGHLRVRQVAPGPLMQTLVSPCAPDL